MTVNEINGLYDSRSGVSIDTRTLRAGQLFFALSGKNVDGSIYAAKALELGAAAAIVKRGSLAPAQGLIEVEDPFETLRALAIYHRQRLEEKGCKFFGLTGTNGKTTTKELIRTALDGSFRVRATEGNYNNDIGVPLTVLSFPLDTEIGIVEMGASHPEDLRPLLEVACPQMGLITNVGRAHLEGFGSFEGVKHAKGLLYDWLHSHDGTIFVNKDDSVLTGMLEERGIYSAESYGMDGVSLLPVTPQQPYLGLSIGGITLTTNLVGAYNAPNVLAAIAVAHHFGIDLATAASRIAGYIPKNNRSQFVRTERNFLIEDYYNANPSSMAVALDNLALCKAPRAALLGEMRELGEYSGAEHRAIVEKILSMELGAVCLVGEEFIKASEGTPLKAFHTSDELREFLSVNPLSGYTILVKGSRGVRMEKVIDLL